MCKGMIRQRIKKCPAMKVSAPDSATSDDPPSSSMQAGRLGDRIGMLWANDEPENKLLHEIATTTDDLNAFAHFANSYLDALINRPVKLGEAPLIEAARMALLHAMNLDKASDDNFGGIQQEQSSMHYCSVR
jgi:hypothetical protein